MTDHHFALLVLASFFVSLTVASWFKTLDLTLWRDARAPLVAGLFAGTVAAFVDAVFIGVLLTLAALYVRLMGRESEPSEGLAAGALTGAVAAIPLIIAGEAPLLRLAQCILAGAGAGFGITFGLAHVRKRARQALVDSATAIVATAIVWLAGLIRLPERDLATAAAALMPIGLVITVFVQWPAVKRVLAEEADLGVLDESEVPRAANPFLRLMRGGWHDRRAHREFVRSAGLLALRKRQQRGRSDDVARIYQVEIMRLRMQLQEMMRIDRAMRASASGQEQTAR